MSSQLPMLDRFDHLLADASVSGHEVSKASQLIGTTEDQSCGNSQRPGRGVRKSWITVIISIGTVRLPGTLFQDGTFISKGLGSTAAAGAWKA